MECKSSARILEQTNNFSWQESSQQGNIIFNVLQQPVAESSIDVIAHATYAISLAATPANLDDLAIPSKAADKYNAGSNVADAEAASTSLLQLNSDTGKENKSKKNSTKQSTGRQSSEQFAPDNESGRHKARCEYLEVYFHLVCIE